MDEGKNFTNDKKLRLKLVLDESTDESNRSELSLIFRIVNNVVIENYLLDLMQLQRYDTKTIFKRFETNLREVELKYNESNSPGWMDAQQCQVNTMV